MSTLASPATPPLTPPLTQWAEDVLRFWFTELHPEDWFEGDPALDEAIRVRFGSLHATLQASPLLPSSLDARTLLAAVIVFDQFSRNLFRKSAVAYVTDVRALELARHAVATGMDRLLQDQQRHFLYMPFMHSEERAVQAESVRLFDDLGLPEAVKWAQHHQEFVERFGRFPHRNSLLGRDSTPDEIEFLNRELRSD